jgi:hypothetical protein
MRSYCKRFLRDLRKGSKKYYKTGVVSMKKLIFIVFMIMISVHSIGFSSNTNWVQLNENSYISVDSLHTKYLGNQFYETLVKIDYNMMRKTHGSLPPAYDKVSCMLMHYSFNTDKKEYRIERILTLGQNNQLLGDAKRPPNENGWQSYLNSARVQEILAIMLGLVLYPNMEEEAPNI